ncbi:MAG TPA: hypothetical protein V6D17_17380 [Candidatus Obscuribacterales bacterium]
MAIIILLLVILCAIVVGRIYVKRQLKALQKERERKAKIAEGIFDSTTADSGSKRKKKKKRKWKWNWFNKSDKLEPYQGFENELLKRLPPIIERVLATRSECAAALQSLIAAERDFVTARHAQEAIALPARIDQADMHGWLIGARSALRNVRARGRDLRACELAFADAHREFLTAAETLEKTLSSIELYNLEDLSEDADRILEIARVANEECGKETIAVRPIDAPRHRPQPETAHAEAEELVNELEIASGNLIDALKAAHQKYLAAQAEFGALAASRNMPDLEEPDKPNEEEVKELLNRALDWANEVQAQEAAAACAVPPLRQAIVELDARLKAVTELVDRLSLWHQQKTEEAENEKKSEPFSVRQTGAGKPHLAGANHATDGEAADKSDADANAKHVNAGASEKETATPPSKEKTGAAFGNGGLFGAQLFGDDGASASKARRPSDGPAALLTDDEQCSLQTASLISNLVAKLSSSFTASAESWSSIKPLAYSNGTIEGADASATASLIAAMRKLGFAVAQRNAAKSKLDAHKSEAASTLVAAEPGLDCANAEAYIRAHQKWCSAKAKNAEDLKQRSDRQKQIEEHLDERNKQLIELVKATDSLVGEICSKAAPDRHRQLDAALKTASMLVKRYTPPPPEKKPSTPPPASTRASSSSSRQKKKRRYGGSYW